MEDFGAWPIDQKIKRVMKGKWAGYYYTANGYTDDLSCARASAIEIESRAKEAEDRMDRLRRWKVEAESTPNIPEQKKTSWIGRIFQK